MKTSILSRFLILFSVISVSSRAQPLYWDSNGATPGAGAAPLGTWGTDTFWSASASGDVATSAWVDGGEAVFSAGTDAAGPFTVSLGGNVSAGGVGVEEGLVTLSGGTLTLASPATVEVGAGLSLDVDSILAGTQGLTKRGPGILRLNQANTFTGTVRIVAGILSVAEDNRLGPVPISPTADAIIMDGGVLQWTATANLTLHGNRGILLITNGTFDQPVPGPPATMRINGVISGPYAIAKTGPGVLALGGVNTFTGGVDLYEGRLNPVADGCLGTGPLRARTNNVTASVALGGSVSVTNDIILDPGATLQLLTGSPLTLSGTISGEGALLRDSTGSGTTTLAGANTFTGGLAISARQIQLAHPQALGTGVLTVGDPFFTPANTIDLQAGANLTGANALANAVVINQNFTISGASEMEFSGPVTLVGVRTMTVSGAGFPKTFSGTISGDTAGITKAGPETLILAGANTYSGNTTVNAGTVLVNNSTGSGTGTGNVTVGSNGTLGGAGGVAGAVTVNGGALEPGASIGKLTLQNGLTLGGGGYTWELGALKDNADGVAGADFDQIAITAGEFATGGSDSLLVRFPDSAVAPDRTVPFWQQPHTWTVVALSGTAANPTNAQFSEVNFLFNDAGIFSNSVAGNGNILLHFTPTEPPTPPPSVFYWDANGSMPGAGDTPTGTWGVDAFWSASAGGDTNTVAWEPGKKAVFASGTDATNAYTVTVNGTRSISGMAVEEGTVTLSGGTLSLASETGATEMSVETNLLTVIASIIEGPDDVVKTGAGTLRFNSANNTYSGSTIIKAGTFTAQSDARLGAVPPAFLPDAITLDGGALEWVATGGQAVNANRGLTLTTNGGTINESGGVNGNITFNGAVTGPGTLTKIGPGILTLTTPNDFAGGIIHREGQIRFNATNAAGTGVITLDSNTVVRTRLISTGAIIPVTNQVMLTGGMATLSPGTGGSEASLEFSGVIGGPGGILRTDPGDKLLIISGSNTFSGGFKITHWPVVIGHKNALGTGPIIIGDEFTDPGTMFIQFNGLLDLTGANAITNPLLVYQQFSMAIAIATNALEFSGPIELVNPNLPIYANYAALTHRLSGVIRSTNGHGFQKYGVGTLVLSAANSYPGGSTVVEGILAVNNTSGSGTGPGPVTLTALTPNARSLVGTGTVAGPVSVLAGTISGGSAATGVGRLTLQSGLDMSSGGTNLWELGSLADDGTGVAGTDFDQIALTGGSLNLGSNAALALSFLGAAAPDPANAFWQAPHAWTVIELSGGAVNAAGAFAAIQNATNSAGFFTNSVAGDGSIVLGYTPTFVPPPPPAIQDLAATATSLSFAWGSTSGFDYEVQFKTNLNQVGWLVLTNVPGTGGLISVTDNHGGESERYYRVAILP